MPHLWACPYATLASTQTGSLMAVIPVNLGETIVAGNDYQITITVTLDGSTFPIGSATLTCSIKAEDETSDVIADHDMTITDGAAGVATLTLTDTETLTLRQPLGNDHLATKLHFGDVRVVQSGGAISNHGPFTFNVRRAIT